MRLIRSVSRPSNTSLLRQFQQCQVNKSSSVRLDPALLEASNLVNKSNVLWHGRPFTASASAASDALEPRKQRRRLSKDERKTILEDYVKKYRETNGGKFPTIKGAIKDVGGSYYLVRHILQELIHKSKQPSEDIKKNSLEKSLSKKDEMSTNIGEVSQTRDLGKVVAPVSKDVGNSSSKVFESKQGQQSSVSVETDKLKDVGTHSDHLIGKLESSVHPDPENNVKQEKPEIKLEFDGLEPKDGQQESVEKSRSKSQNAPSGDAEPQERSSVWNNLKSLANGILSLWKRS